MHSRCRLSQMRHGLRVKKTKHTEMKRPVQNMTMQSARLSPLSTADDRGCRVKNGLVRTVRRQVLIQPAPPPALNLVSHLNVSV